MNESQADALDHDADGPAENAEPLRLPDDRKPRVYLPSWRYGFEQTGRAIFQALADRKLMYRQELQVVEIAQIGDGDYKLVPVVPAAFRCRLEQMGETVAYRADNRGKYEWRPARISVDNAETLLVSMAARELLPVISTVVSCPVATIGYEGEFKILSKGYHPDQGGLMVTGGADVIDVSLEKAVDTIGDILGDFEFVSNADFSRAYASILTPGIALGGLLGPARAPIDLAMASKSQSGKTYRQKMIAAVYGETPYVIAQRKGGVGGLEESFAQGLLSGRPFIQADNLRAELSSTYFESFMSADKITARVPHRNEIEIKTARVFLMLTSNQFKPTKDLLNRCSIIRIDKREQGFAFKTWDGRDALNHVRACQPFFLSCVFRIIREWVEKGRPRTSESRHDLREWAQSLDWIVQNIAGLQPLLDDYENVVENFKLAKVDDSNIINLADYGDAFD